MRLLQFKLSRFLSSFRQFKFRLLSIPPTATYTYLPLPPNGMYLTSKLTCLIMSTVNTHTFNGPLSSTTRVSQYQNTKTNLDFTAARDSEWQWHQLGHMEVCTSLQIDKDASTTQLSLLQALPAVQPTASKHWRHLLYYCNNNNNIVKYSCHIVVSMNTVFGIFYFKLESILV